MTKIDSFSGDNRWLSNFWPATIEYEGDSYRSVECAYQAAKTDDKKERTAIRLAAKSGDAKRLGRTVTIRPDWDKQKVHVMYELLQQKFSVEPLRGKLIATGDSELIEGNHWHDTFWGVCNGRGENWLGRLLMRVRDELKDTPTP